MEEPAEVTPEVQAKYDLVVRNLQEVLGGDKLKKQIASGKNVHLYWGTATTGRPHIGYLVPMQKIADFLHAGLRVTILFADLHAFLDNMKSTWELLENRVIYYEHVIKALLQSVNVPIEKLHFVRGTTYQLSREYTFDILKLCTQVTQRDALRAGAEVVKQVDSPLLSGLLYPLLQAVDEQYLKVDGQFGGVDQRKIFILAEEQLPKIKLGKRWHLMNPMVPGLTGSKMSSSEADSKIDLLDDAQLVERKIAGAVCELDAGDNGVLAFYEHVLFPIILPKPVIVGNKEFLSISGIKTAFAEGAVTAEQLKTTLHTFINDLLSRVQKECATPEIKEAITKGYQAVQAREVASVSNVQLDLSPGQRSLLEKIKCGFEVSGCEIALQRALAEDRAVNVVIPLFCKGRFHIGFLVPLLHVKKLVARGVPVRVTVLLSDMVGFLDNEKVAWTVRDARCAYFAAMCRSAIRHLELDNYVTVARAADSEHQFSKDYVLDMYKMASIVSRDETSLAEGSFLSGNLLSLIYALDVHYCSNADVVLLGDDEQKTALIAERLWTRSLAVSGPTQLHYPYLIGMDEAKMSAGNPEFMLDPHDTPKQIKTKIGRSFCEPQNVQRNVALELARQLVFPLIDGKPLEIKRSPDNGGDISLNSFDALVKEFEVGTTIPLHPADLKAAIIGAINGFCDLLRADVPASVVASAFPVSKGGKGNKKK